jgi:DNA-binding transcriptional LysR family regulator
MLDLRLLHQAQTLARHRNFARAAEALHMTQPALSRSIAGLEASLGERLFDRTQQGVEPTAFGRLLLARGAGLLDASAELERDFRQMRGLEHGELRVGAGAYPTEISVGRAAGRLLARHPRMRVELVQTDLREMVDAVLARRLDLAVLELSLVTSEPRLATEALPEHRATFYCRAGHPLVHAPSLSLEHVLAFPYAGTRLSPRVAKSFAAISNVGWVDPVHGDYLPPIMVDSLRAARDVVLGSDAFAAAPHALIDADVRAGLLATLPLAPPWLHTAYGFVYLAERALSPAAWAFMAEVRAVEQEQAASAAPGLGARGEPV